MHRLNVIKPVILIPSHPLISTRNSPLDVLSFQNRVRDPTLIYPESFPMGDWGLIRYVDTDWIPPTGKHEYTA